MERRNGVVTLDHMSNSTDSAVTSTARDVAISNLRRKKAFQSQVVSYLILNAFMWGIWFFTKGDSADGYWPAWVTLATSIGLAVSWWHAYGEKPITESEIQQEMARTKDAVAVGD